MFDYAVKNNFFDEKDLASLKNQLVSIEYNPPSNSKIDEFQGTFWHIRNVHTNSEVGSLIIKKIEEHFYYKINELVKINYTMVGAKDYLRPHTDESEQVTHQCLIYIAGSPCIDSGTGFFVKKDEHDYLDTIMGFRENKAIFFNSKSLHSPLHAHKQKGNWRYSIATFFN